MTITIRRKFDSKTVLEQTRELPDSAKRDTVFSTVDSMLRALNRRANGLREAKAKDEKVMPEIVEVK